MRIKHLFLKGLTKKAVRERLLEARGDLFVAAAMLGCTRRDLDHAIRSDPAMQVYVAGIERAKVSVEYDRLSREQFEARVSANLQAYMVDALDHLYRLATMDHGDSAAMAKVKLEACIALQAGIPVGAGKGVELERVLQELDQAYQVSAPRIREIRHTVITLQGRAASAPPDESIEPALPARLPGPA